ncbi:MAG: hypothetical protein WDW36_009715 [Sanguina aurantia]
MSSPSAGRQRCTTSQVASMVSQRVSVPSRFVAARISSAPNIMASLASHNMTPTSCNSSPSAAADEILELRSRLCGAAPVQRLPPIWLEKHRILRGTLAGCAQAPLPRQAVKRRSANLGRALGKLQAVD